MARRPQSLPNPSSDLAWSDPRLLGLLEEIERENTPERLLKLATLLQEQLLLSKEERDKQRRNPH